MSSSHTGYTGSAQSQSDGISAHMPLRQDNSIGHESPVDSLTAQGSSDSPEQLISCGYSLYNRFKRLGDVSDLDKAIEYENQAILLTPHGHSDLPERLRNLSISFHTRFIRLGKLSDLDKAIEHYSQAVSMAHPDDPHMPNWNNNLGSFLKNRFERLGEVTDLDQAIMYQSQAVSLASHDDSYLPSRLLSLGGSLYHRFLRLGDVEDLDKAIKYHSQAILLTPECDSDLPKHINILGNCFHSRFDRLGELADLEKAIQHYNQGVLLKSQGSPYHLILLGNLGAALQGRFERLGDVKDLDKAIEYQIQAVSLIPKSNSDLPQGLQNLSITLQTRFERLGEVADLDKAIEYENQAVVLTPQGHPDLPKRLGSLGTTLLFRFERLGRVVDLDKAIEYQSQEVSLTPQDHSDLPTKLNNLSISHHSRFERLGYVTDLDKAIEYQSQAVSLTPQGHSDMRVWVGNLGAFLDSRFQKLAEVEDLNKAISYGSQAVLLTPQDHPALPVRLLTLGLSLDRRFKHLSKLSDPHDVPKATMQLVSSGSDLHAVPPNCFTNSGKSFTDWSILPAKTKDFYLSIDCFQKSAQSLAGPPGPKLSAALHWGRMSDPHDTSLIIPAYKQVMEILPRLVWLGAPAESRFRLIQEAGNLSTEVTAAAIKMKDYELALEWLEEGRSIVWKQMLQLRTPIDDLNVISPTLTAELKQVAQDLDQASAPKPLSLTLSPDNKTQEQAAQQHRRLAERWEKLLEQVRGLPGFEAFLRPQKVSELMRSAQSGPVVVINALNSRCAANVHGKDSCYAALIMQPGLAELLHVPLKFTPQKAARARVEVLNYVRGRSMSERAVEFHQPDPKDQFREMLAVLWEEVVKPVLESLGYLKSPATGNLPHITWCTTGPLSFLPLHAAGDYDSGDTSFNHVVSSYTPTLSALISSQTQCTTFSGILAVGQQFAPSMNDLPGTVTELTRIQEQSQGCPVTRLEGDLATPSAVMGGMENHSWVHFACHASQNPTNPIRSAFYLHEGKLDLATITQKRLKNAELAFLSACQTATGDENLSEEAVHLAAGMLMAGYRTVIGTMWSIGDEDAPLFAEKVYEHLMEGGKPDSRRAAVAVHKATERLREKVGVEAFEKWAPYIHMGQ